MKERDQRVKCPKEGCNRVLSGYNGLHAHLKAHARNFIPKRQPPSDQVFICTHFTCQKTFKQKSYLIRHIRNYHLPSDCPGVIEVIV